MSDANPKQSAADTLAELQADLEKELAPELAEIYREEAEDHVKNIYSGLNALKDAPDNLDQLQAVRRSAHTLKGAAGAVGLRVVTKLSHRMEDLLDYLYDFEQPLTKGHLELLLDTTDQLSDMSFGTVDRDRVATLVGEIYTRFETTMNAAATSDAAATQEEKAPSKSEDTAKQQQKKTATTRPAAAKRPTETAKKQPEQETGQSDEKIATVKAPAAKAPQPASKKAPAKAGKGAQSQTNQTQQILRVPLSRIDDAVSVVSELIISRTTLEQRMGDFAGSVTELNAILSRIRNVALEMETRYSVDALGTNPVFARPVVGGATGIAPASNANDSDSSSEFDALEFDRYSSFHLLSRSVSEVSSDIGTVAQELRTLLGDFDALLNRQDRLSRDTQDRLMRVRMVPFEHISQRLQRAARNVAKDQSKEVEFIFEGKDTEIDKTVLEEIADPLLHLIRNCVDHGIESGDVREKCGKPQKATVRLRAFYQGTQAVLQIGDDGRGLDHVKILQVAVAKGIISQDEASTATPQEVYPLIFVPGLSTAKKVSEVSGRGVGMDIVRDKVQKLKGTIQVDSEPGKGTTFTISLPLKLAVARALMVNAGNEVFAIPMQSISQITRFERSEITQVGAQQVVKLNGVAYPLIRLADRLSLLGSENESPTIPVLIVRSGDVQVALQVDQIVAGRDIVIKTLGTHLREVPGFVGATLMGDGTVVPILDVNLLTDEFDANAKMRPVKRAAESQETVVMIVDDSVSVRRVMENLVKAQGWRAVVAKDGVDAVEVLQAEELTPDIFLLDVEMPRMDGYEFLATLRGLPETKDAPVVMVTSRAGQKHRDKAFSLGASDYLVKPYQDEQLIELVNRLTRTAVSV